MQTQLPEKRSKLYWTLSDSIVLSKRSMKHIVRNMDQLMGIILMPTMFLLLFRYVFGGAIDTGGTSYVNFLIAGILVQTAAFGASTTTLNIVFDLQRGIVDRFRSLPMTSSSFLVGHVVADLVRNTASALVMIIVGFIVGFRPTASPVEWVLIIALLLAFTFAFSWFSAVIGLLVKTVEAAQWMGFMIVMPLTFASSAFVPTDTMPTVLRVFAENQPFTHVIGAMRAWMVGTPIGTAGYWAFGWCIALILVCVPLSGLLFRRSKA